MYVATVEVNLESPQTVLYTSLGICLQISIIQMIPESQPVTFLCDDIDDQGKDWGSKKFGAVQNHIVQKNANCKIETRVWTEE